VKNTKRILSIAVAYAIVLFASIQVSQISASAMQKMLDEKRQAEAMKQQKTKEAEEKHKENFFSNNKQKMITEKKQLLKDLKEVEAEVMEELESATPAEKIELEKELTQIRKEMAETVRSLGNMGVPAN
jgi:hypothetical protein